MGNQQAPLGKAGLPWSCPGEKGTPSLPIWYPLPGGSTPSSTIELCLKGHDIVQQNDISPIPGLGLIFLFSRLGPSPGSACPRISGTMHFGLRRLALSPACRLSLPDSGILSWRPLPSVYTLGYCPYAENEVKATLCQSFILWGHRYACS